VIVRRELVLAGSDAAALVDFVEEPLDQITSVIEMQAEADRLLTIPPWLDVRPRAAFIDKGSDPIRVKSAIPQPTVTLPAHRFSPAWQQKVTRTLGADGLDRPSR
jgi:hypothetical protein